MPPGVGKKLLIAAAIAASFISLALTITMLLMMGLVTLAMAKLLFAALFGIYVGFGALVAVYRFVVTLK